MTESHLARTIAGPDPKLAGLVRQSQGINKDIASRRRPSHSRPGISVEAYPGVAYRCDFEKGRLRQLSWDEQTLCSRRPRGSEELATPISEVKGSYRYALTLNIERHPANPRSWQFRSSGQPPQTRHIALPLAGSSRAAGRTV